MTNENVTNRNWDKIKHSTNTCTHFIQEKKNIKFRMTDQPNNRETRGMILTLLLYILKYDNSLLYLYCNRKWYRDKNSDRESCLPVTGSRSVAIWLVNIFILFIYLLKTSRHSIALKITTVNEIFQTRSKKGEGVNKTGTSRYRLNNHVLTIFLLIFIFDLFITDLLFIGLMDFLK